MKPGDQWGAGPWACVTTLLCVDSLSQPVVPYREAKISRTPKLNKSMVLINLLEAPLRSSRPSLQHRRVLPSGFEGHGGKGKAWHTVTAGHLNPCRAAASHHGEFPDCMSTLSAILETARSVQHAFLPRESVPVMLPCYIERSSKWRKMYVLYVITFHLK